jgi:serine/alanine adding enzyme
MPVTWRLASIHEWSDVVRGSRVVGDIYSTPEYAFTCEGGMHEGAAKCLLMRANGHEALFPFIERAIPALPGVAERLLDVVTPYGYGGLVWHGDDTQGSLFWGTVKEALRELGYVAAFVRWHPLLDNQRAAGDESTYVRTTLAVDLSGTASEPEAFWKKQSLQQVHQAQRNGLEFDLLSSPSNMELCEFGTLYAETMDRLAASQYYRFDGAYWNSLKTLVASHELFLARVTLGGRLAAESVLLSWQGRYLHYHLSASAGGMLQLRPNNLLLWGIERWAKQQGYHFLHLGGGVTSGDGLELFKRSVSNVERRFHVSRCILREDVYRELAQARGVNESVSSGDSNGFFPAYRSLA